MFGKTTILFTNAKQSIIFFVKYFLLLLYKIAQFIYFLSNTMDIASKITKLRKELNMSQAELADKVAASRTIIGNYERGLNVPSLEMVVKLAKAFNVTTDYLINDGQYSHYDKEIIKRIEAIEALDDDTKSKLYFLIDNVTQNFMARQAYAI